MAPQLRSQNKSKLIASANKNQKTNQNQDMVISKRRKRKRHDIPLVQPAVNNQSNASTNRNQTRGFRIVLHKISIEELQQYGISPPNIVTRHIQSNIETNQDQDTVIPYVSRLMVVHHLPLPHTLMYLILILLFIKFMWF